MSESNNSVITKKEDKDSVSQVLLSQSFSGPLPHPSILKGYEEVLPGLADRITAMAEKQSIHRQTLESRVVNFDTVKSVFGLVCAFVFSIGSLVAGVFVALKGQPWAGSIMSVIPMGTIVGAFIYQRRGESDKKE